MKYQLIRFSIGETNCEHCGKAIKNIFTILDTELGIELNVGSECVQKLLQVETLPKEYKQIEKEYKTKKFNESIINMIVSVRPNFVNTNLYKALINGTVKATDKSTLLTIAKNNYYELTFTQENEPQRYNSNIIYWINKKGTSYQERQKTEEEYKSDVENLKNTYKTYFLSDFATTKECKKFIDELVKYIEENYKVWGWTVKYLVNR